MTHPNPDLIEHRFKEALEAYIATGRHPGGFLNAILCNDLMEAVARADESALDNLPHIVSWLYNEVPISCWGSPERVKYWLQHMETLTSNP